MFTSSVDEQPNEQSSEDQCAAAEQKAKAHSVPIFGLSGPGFDMPNGKTVEPGPMFWEASSDSYIESLKDADSIERLLKTTGDPSAAASPGNVYQSF